VQRILGINVMKIRLAAALWLAASIVPAAADSRDLVMERLSRCYGIGDTRQYLDCFYAAAQPLRSELGLAPAPQAQNYVPLFARPAAPGAYIPQAAPGAYVPQAAAAAPPHDEVASASSGGTFDFMASLMGISTKKVAPEQFGFKNARPGVGTNVDHIVSRMTSYKIDRRTGWFTVVLENGQVWEQVVGDEKSADWTDPASTYTATVEYGALGSFNMIVSDGTRRAYKVKRTK
jgi:hypothetical protein